MKRTALAALAAALALAAPAGAAQREPRSAVYDSQFTLQPNTTQTYRVVLDVLWEQCNTLEPGWGLDVRGPGVDLAAGMFFSFFGGPLEIEPGKESLPDGGIPGAQRQPDGTFAVPVPDATPFTAEQVRLGSSLREVGWNWRRLDGWGNPRPTAGTARSARRARRMRARRLRAARRKIRAGAAQAGPVKVTLAGFQHWGLNAPQELVAKVTTGELAGPTTLTLHARVAIQPGTSSRTPDGCKDA